MKPVPAVPTTLVTNTGSQWEPASFSEFLEELAHVHSHCASLNHYILYRGHARVAWRLDSTFARFVKTQILGINPSDQIKDDYRHSLEFHRLLNSLFLCKFGTLTLPSAELLRASEKHGLDPWFEWMKRIQQYPKDDLTNLRGTFLLDWTQDWRIAVFFANHERLQDEPGAVYIADGTEAGSILHRDLMVGDILAKIREAFLKDQPLGCPLIFCPQRQIACQRAKNQDAIYVAQMDLRVDLTELWHLVERERSDGSRILLRILLPKATTHEAQKWLDKHGVTEQYVYPDKGGTPTNGHGVKSPLGSC